MRNRKNQIKIYMNDDELKRFEEKCNVAGQSKQAFILSAVDGATIATDEEVALFKTISSQIADFIKQIKGMANNINQQARKANEMGYMESVHKLEEQLYEITEMKKEGDLIWQSLRLLISRQNRMER